MKLNSDAVTKMDMPMIPKEWKICLNKKKWLFEDF
jgi:hypothetical protein